MMKSPVRSARVTASWLTLVLASVLVPVSAAQAFDPAHVNKLKLLKNCPACDLSGAKLRYIELKNANLKDANLSGAQLYDADLSGADLTGANLTGADLEKADLNGANLERAKLGEANLKAVYFLRANLTGADLATAVNVGENGVAEAFLCETVLPGGLENRDCR